VLTRRNKPFGRASAVLKIEARHPNSLRSNTV
jgi:hypothetical protein